MKTLKIYSKSYYQYYIKQEHNKYIKTLLKSETDEDKRKYAFDRACVMLAYAGVFDCADQFKDKESLSANSKYDYVHGPHKIKLVYSKPNEYDGLSGDTQEFFAQRWFLKEGTTLVYAVLRYPFVQFVGWSTADVRNFTPKGNRLLTFAGSDNVKPFIEHKYLYSKGKEQYVIK